MALNFDMLPTTGGFTLPEEGWHKATIAECKLGRTNDGREKLELTYNLASGSQVRFDNIVTVTADGQPMNYGQFKLRELLVAVNVIPQGNFELNIVPMLVNGKALDLKVKHKEVNGKTYCEVDGANFKPVGTMTTTSIQPAPAADVAPIDFNTTFDVNSQF